MKIVSAQRSYNQKSRWTILISLLLCSIIACTSAPIGASLRATNTISSSPEDESILLSEDPVESFSDERILGGDVATDDGHGDDHGDDHGSHGFGTHVEYEKIYDSLVFIFAIWFGGKLTAKIGMPALVGEIIVGFLLGPPLADYVPYEEAFVLIGEIGLIALLLEAGIEVDIAQLGSVGPIALVMALLGTVLPMAIGFGLANASGLSGKGAVAVGFAFCPTSLAVASKALAAGGLLNTPIGGLIVSACVLDDILALILLSVLKVIAMESPKLIQFFIPFISSFGFLLVLGWAGITWLPKLIEKHILTKFKEKDRPNVAFVLMLVLMMAYMPPLYYTKASHLTGAFLAGLTFSQIHSIHHSFVKKTHSLMTWMLRIFFATTIGFQVPLKSFNDGHIIAWGFIFYLCIIAKLPLGCFVPHYDSNIPDGFPFNPHTRDILTVGLAMTCRGEFSFIIASLALSEGMIDNGMYASIVWAVLLSCITCPYALMMIVKYYNNKSEEFFNSKVLNDPDADSSGATPFYVVIQVRSGVRWGLQNKMKKAAQQQGLIIIDHRSWNPRSVDPVVATEMYCQDTKINVPAKKVMDLKKSVVVGSFAGDKLDTNAEDEEEAKIFKRCNEIRESIMEATTDDTSRVRVFQWVPQLLKYNEELTEEQELKVQNQVKKNLEKHESGDYMLGEDSIFSDSERAKKVPARGVNKQFTQRTLWEDDEVAQKAGTLADNDTDGRLAQNQNNFMSGGNLPCIEENLGGFVRTQTKRFSPEATKDEDTI